MKFLHLSDLHFGKSLHNVSMLEEDQAAWVENIVGYVRREKPDAVLVSGDVFDRSNPAKEAQTLFSRFLSGLSEEGIPVIAIAGNHDSGERLEYLDSFLQKSNVHVSGRVREKLVRVVLKDEYGPVNFYLLPFYTPASIKYALGREDLKDMDEATEAILEAQGIDWNERNVLLMHQTIAYGGDGPVFGKSETSVGGSIAIDGKALEKFDYVALGHIHGSQKMGKDYIRYAGSPLCYHFSEASQKKGPLMVEMGPKGEDVSIRMEEIPVLHRVRPTITGKFEEVLSEAKANPREGEYVRVVLTDETLPPGAYEALETAFRENGSRLLELSREYIRRDSVGDAIGALEEKSIEEHFRDFFWNQSHRELDEGEALIVGELARRIGDNGEDLDELVDSIVKIAVKAAEEEVR